VGRALTDHAGEFVDLDPQKGDDTQAKWHGIVARLCNGLFMVRRLLAVVGRAAISQQRRESRINAAAAVWAAAALSLSGHEVDHRGHTCVRVALA
jgi:hypothetical protein